MTSRRSLSMCVSFFAPMFSLTSGCVMPPPTADDLAQVESAQEGGSTGPSHCDPNRHYRNAEEFLRDARLAAMRAIANCEKACADAMTDRDDDCADLPPPADQNECRDFSHQTQAICAAMCRTQGWPADPDIDPMPFNPPDPARVPAAQRCLQSLGALRAGYTCAGRGALPTQITISYTTVRGVEMEMTCYADGRNTSRRRDPIVIEGTGNWWFPPHF